MAKIEFEYNAPVVLTFSLICTAVFFIDQLLLPNLISEWFTLRRFNPENWQRYPTLVSYTIGHASAGHLMSNSSFILLLGPIVEEKYGSRKLLLMILIVALVTGGLELLLFRNSLMGASGIVYMLIVLAAFTGSKGKIPITLILVLMLFLGTEIYKSVQGDDNISQFAHIVGGFCGLIFGYTKLFR